MAATAPAAAQLLPLRHYSTADGLAHDVVVSLYEDSRGYLWIGTLEGASRFDGAGFTTFGRRHALPSTLITRFLETPAGELWAATSPAGVFRYRDDQAAFERISVGEEPGANRVVSLAHTAATLWAVTDRGLYRGSGATPLTFERVIDSTELENGGPSLTDSRGRTWVGLKHRIIELSGARARIVHELPATPREPNDVVGIAEDRRGLVFAALRGVWRRDERDHSIAQLPLALHDGESIHAIAADGDSMWVGTSAALIRIEDGRAVRYGPDQGIRPPVLGLLRSRFGHLWIGTMRGLYALRSDRTFGVRPPNGEPVLRVIKSGDAVFAFTPTALIRIDGAGASSSHDLPGVGARVVKGLRDEWWMASDDRVLVASGSPLARRRVLGPGNGWPAGVGVHASAGQEAVGMHLDRDGTMWLAGSDNQLYRCTAANVRARCATVPHPGVSWRRRPVTLGGDRQGTLFVASVSGLGRLSGDAFRPISLLTGSRVELSPALFVDSRQRLWVGTHHYGAALLPDPSGPSPNVEFITTEHGLASDAVFAFAEAGDAMYVGTGRGLSRLEPRDGRFVASRVDLGFETGQVHDLLFDGAALWIAAANGVFWQHRRDERSYEPAPTLITRITANGVAQAVRDGGIDGVRGLVFDPGTDHVQVDFLSPHPGQQAPAYQYRLNDAAAWNGPHPTGSITLSALQPGHYQIEARALTPAGVAVKAAVMQFDVLAPVWQRTWFRALAVAAIGLAAFAAHRWRLRQVLAVEQVRSRIAADLHDDIGSRLAEIAMVSELGQSSGGDDAAVRQRFAAVAATAREVRQSMSDVVWAIDPRRDHLVDLVDRTRLAAEALLGPGIGFELRMPPGERLHTITLGADVRRHLVLCIREALVNVEKHAAASRVDLEFEVRGHALVVRIADNGRGIDAAATTRGYGLGSLQRRAEAVGGTLAISRPPAGGTQLLFTVPLRRWRLGRMKR
jgi:signal transduction histidine kinase